MIMSALSSNNNHNNNHHHQHHNHLQFGHNLDNLYSDQSQQSLQQVHIYHQQQQQQEQQQPTLQEQQHYNNQNFTQQAQDPYQHQHQQQQQQLQTQQQASIMNQPFSNFKQKNIDNSMMDANNIDENMTVPHPSRQQTTATTMHNNIVHQHPQHYMTNNEAMQQQTHQHQHQPHPYPHYAHHQQHQQHQHQPHPHQVHNVHQSQHTLYQNQVHAHHQQQFHQYQQQQHPPLQQENIIYHHELQPVKNELEVQIQHQHHHQHQQQQPQQHQLINQPQLDDEQQCLAQLKILENKTFHCDELLKQSQQGQEDFILQLQRRSKLHAASLSQDSQIPSDPQSLENAHKTLQQYELLLKDKALNLNRIRMNLLSHQREILNQLSYIQNQVINVRIPNWHQLQQYANNGAEVETSAELDKIQILVEKLTNITWRIRNQLRILHLLITTKQNVPFNLEELNRLGIDVNRSLETLILKTFVVEKQPPQVMKTNTRFTSTVRFLSGNQLNVSMINPTVRVTILSESNARLIFQRHKEMIESSWDFDKPSITNPQQHEGFLQTKPITSPQVTPPQSQSTSTIYSSLSPDRQHSSPAALSIASRPGSTEHGSVSGSPSPQQLQFNHQQQQVSRGVVVAAPMTNLAQQSANVNRENKILNMNEFEPSGEILNSSNTLEYQENSRQLLCHFRNMTLKKIKRAEKKGTESVMDEKFVLLFHCVFRIAAPFFDPGSYLMQHQKPVGANTMMFNQSDLTFHIMAFSLPVVVIVHGNQEPHAWATVTWHNAFARPDDLLYRVPDKVPWRELGSVLSDKFRSFAGKGLSEQNLDYLGSKICRDQYPDCDEAYVTWIQFAKELLPDRTFTFWEWFHSILKLTKEHLRNLWSANRIYGFVGKKNCHELLLGSGCQSLEPKIGTFLLRYSETELGGITIAWLCDSTKMCKNGSSQIAKGSSPTNSLANAPGHLQPFVSKDLNTRSLADRIRDLPDLVYLYPDIPKDEAFVEHYSIISDTTPLSNGYIKPMLIQTLVKNYPKNLKPTGSTQSESAQTPATPSSFSHGSPEGIYQENAFITDMDYNYPS